MDIATAMLKSPICSYRQSGTIKSKNIRLNLSGRHRRETGLQSILSPSRLWYGAHVEMYAGLHYAPSIGLVRRGIAFLLGLLKFLQTIHQLNP